MALKSILVQMTGYPSDSNRLDVALALAAEHDARLDGLFVWQQIQIPNYASVYIPPAVYTEHEEEARQRAGQAKNDFYDRLSRQGIAGEWHFRNGDIVRELERQARFAELIIVGQSDEQYGTAGDATTNDAVVLSTGRPTLLIPDGELRPGLGERILVGWNASAEAVRAIRGAMPLLRRAEQVEVFTVDETSHNDGPVTDDISALLARHGVNVVASRAAAADESVGDYLLSRAAAIHADLIVTGAYGHSRWYEAILGGVTHRLLRQIEIPVLMAC